MGNWKKLGLGVAFSAFTAIFCHAEVTDVSPELAKIIADSPVPALSAAVIVDGKIVAAGASGVRRRDRDTAVTVKDKFHIGSCTKSMTATLAAIMVKEGTVSWDDTIGDAFSRIRVHKDYQDVTLRQLLCNTGGCPKDLDPDLWRRCWKARGTAEKQRMVLAEGVLTEAPTYPPGTRQLYSNTGFAIAGMMLEKAAKKPWETLLTEKLFVPLDMQSAGFRAPGEARKLDQPWGHAPDPIRPGPDADNPRAIAPAGAVHCDVIDFAKYARFHLGHGPDGVLDKDALEFLHNSPFDDRDYSMGWVRAERGWARGVALTHTGSNTMWYAVIWIAPERDFAAVAMSNLGGDDAFKKCDAAIAHLIREHL